MLLLRIVLDTNVLISAIICDGKPRKLLQSGINREYVILSSLGILDELSEVLQRPKFKMTGDDIIGIVSTLIETVENVHVTSEIKAIKNDPDDDILINAAYDGNADYIVSGDPDLLSLKKFNQTKIVSVDSMLKILEKQ